ncbi:MAG: helix-turn-helix transcriptional regulator [Bdellovibrionales bacterium]|nr:helix-turn-helix transcriptional regulator [Bdellovibrionales bacterium]
MRKKLSLAEKIALLAKHSGVSQSAIADQVGVPASHVNHFFRGKGDVRSELFIEILKTLNIDIEALINKEVARMNDLDLEEKQNAGEVFERLVKSFDKTDREAIVQYIDGFAVAQLGSKAKKQTKVLKELI